MHSRHHWDIFCRVIDNYGDAGVCWRLAHDLASRGKTVHLWIDDATPLSWMAPQGCAGVTVHNWQDAPQHYEPGQAIIEAFGCELDDAVKAKLAQAARTKDPARPEPDSVHPELVEGQPTWINLEYLSAEDYVRRSHGLPSPQMSGPAKGLTKHFFYPGFTEGTGGLIREQNLVERQQNFKPEPWLQSQGIPLSPNALRVSLFCYEPPALAQLIAQLQALPRPTQLLVTHGRSTTHCRQTLARIGLPEHGAGTLQIIYLPALTQDDYDHLLWSCDLNFVRGEDSLVRAIWTGIPFVWNIYPQDDGAHVAKLRAFMNLMPLSAAQRGWFEGWNEAGSGRPGALDELLQADASSMTMLRNMSMPSDLANQLMEFALAENSIHETRNRPAPADFRPTCIMIADFDAVIIGAGAAGLFCAAQAGQLGRKVLLLDHSERIAEKLRISGGGRCNFTNRDLDVRAPQKHFISDNPHFCRSALSRYTPQDFIDLMNRHGIAWHEKHKGQLFCDDSSEQIIRMLLAECDAGNVTRWHGCAVQAVESIAAAPEDRNAPRYRLCTARGEVLARSVVVATGGLSIPAIGASGWGYDIARQFGLRIVPTRPALVPLTFSGESWQPYAGLAGLSLPVDMAVGEKKQAVHFLEDLLFTHRGLSGPAVLQISSYWREGQPLTINLTPGQDMAALLTNAKLSSKKTLANELAQHMPARLADGWASRSPDWQRPVNQTTDKALAALAQAISQWQITPSGTEGYKKAEVTAGGVDTRDLSGQTMESKQPGLYFIGEVVDVTGWLGGYNFQWAWASAYACAQALATN